MIGPWFKKHWSNAQKHGNMFPPDHKDKPKHFLVKLEGETPEQFVHCFNGGTVIQRQDGEQFITASGLDYDPNLLGKIQPRSSWRACPEIY
jgi:hypothetical protein